MHIMDSYYYLSGKSLSAETLLQNMTHAGIWGGCILSKIFPRIFLENIHLPFLAFRRYASAAFARP